MSAFRAADHTAADHPLAISEAGSLSLLDLRRRLPELAVGNFVNKDRGLPNSYVKQAGGTTVVQINTSLLAWKEVSLRESFEVENGGKVVGEGGRAGKILGADEWNSQPSAPRPAQQSQAPCHPIQPPNHVLSGSSLLTWFSCPCFNPFASVFLSFFPVPAPPHPAVRPSCDSFLLSMNFSFFNHFRFLVEFWLARIVDLLPSFASKLIFPTTSPSALTVSPSIFHVPTPPFFHPNLVPCF
jgi:hypothetical protein